MILRRKGDKSKYEFIDYDCLGRTCFQPGHFQVRGATLAGSRNTGATRACCMHRAYHGCPDGPETITECDCPGTPHTHHKRVGLLLVDPELIKKRKEEGWR